MDENEIELGINEDDQDEINQFSPIDPPSSSSLSNGHFKLFNKMELLEFKDKFVIRAIDSPNHGFCANRFDGNIHSLSSEDVLENPTKTSSICGVIGTIRLVAGEWVGNDFHWLLPGMYILVITSSKEVGKYLGFPIYRVESLKYLPCNQALKELSGPKKKDEAYFRNLLRVVESTPGLYYSYETDVTVNLQRRLKLAEGWTSKPIWKQADPRFVWNRALLDELIECKVFVPVTLHCRCLLVPIYTLDWTRMWRRGANLAGDAANFIETEQLVELKGIWSSFIQVRGSIPLLWEQVVDLSYKPRLNIINHDETPKVVERHFFDLSQRYGEILALDLTDKDGDEGKLSSAYAAEMQNLPNVRYVSFDFHTVCGNSNFDNLNVLYDQIREDLKKQGFEGSISESSVGSSSVVLWRIDVFSSDESISTFSEEYDKFKILWVEHGDEISLEYAGTHALKRDLVRYGKRTLGGVFMDGMSALSRYYLNNFQDGVRQAISSSGFRIDNRRLDTDIFLSKPRYENNPPCIPKYAQNPIANPDSVPFNVLVGRNAHQYVSSVLWAGVTAGVMALVKANGRQFCSRPRLCGLI
ncbi:hypothetical protein KSS87_007429 [Heliosperma pusillum]|nr:hypothetical protein KSS87_007429 [Heliosperma pusillum]